MNDDSMLGRLMKQEETEERVRPIYTPYFASSLRLYMNYDNDDPKYEGSRQRQSKDQCAQVIVNGVINAYDHLTEEEKNLVTLKKAIIGYKSYENDDPTYEGYRQHQSQEQYAEMILAEVRRQYENFNFDEHFALQLIEARGVELYPGQFKGVTVDELLELDLDRLNLDDNRSLDVEESEWIGLDDSNNGPKLS